MVNLSNTWVALTAQQQFTGTFCHLTWLCVFSPVSLPAFMVIYCTKAVNLCTLCFSVSSPRRFSRTKNQAWRRADAIIEPDRNFMKSHWRCSSRKSPTFLELCNNTQSLSTPYIIIYSESLLAVSPWIHVGRSHSVLLRAHDYFND